MVVWAKGAWVSEPAVMGGQVMAQMEREVGLVAQRWMAGHVFWGVQERRGVKA